MRIPNNFNSVVASLNYTPLALGGHVCKIIGAEETKTKTTGKDMLKIALDIAPGEEQAGYYQQKYDADDRPGKKWPCVTYIVSEDNNGNTSRSLAGFVVAVEESNPGFAFPWDKPALLKGKLVGGVFGQEEYMGDDGKLRKSTKVRWFQSKDTVKDAKVPELKKLKAGRTSAARVDTFTDISTDDIPF